MKTTNPYIILVLTVLLLAGNCETRVKFEVPQPDRGKNLAAIPDNYQGNYLELSDSISIRIEEKYIIKEELRIAKLTKQQLWTDLDTVFEVDTVVTIVDNMTVEFDFYDDSVQMTTHDIDTLFGIDQSSHLREFKGFLFLNTLLDNDLWKVKIMKVKGDSLMLSQLVKVEEIESVSSITHVTTIRDTLEHKPEEFRLKPSKSELKKILAGKELDFGYIKE